ncbi:polyamine-modulated factor 1-binding protein 1-like [Panicum virgatum]|nr:polyamine-modulated factor 1-binding protein 1-like [Panicum virgatum]
MANAGRKLPYAFLLLLALAAGVLCVVVLQKVREQRIFAGRLQERDRQLVSLRILLQKEKAFNREMKRKLDEMKATTTSLRTQKIDQKTKLKGLEATVANLKKTQKEKEAALAEKDNRINLMEEAATNLKKARRELEATLTEKDRHIRQMDENATNATNTQKELEAVLREKDSRIRQMEEKAIGSNPDQMAALMEILQWKEAELEEIKTRFQDFKKTDRVDVHNKSTPVQTNNTSTTPNIVVVKRSMNSSIVAIPVKSEEKISANTTVVESAKPEEKRPANTTVVESAKPEEKRPANNTVVESAKPEEKRLANTTVVESKRSKDRSLEEKPVKSATNMEDDGIQGNLNDFDDDIDFDDIYGESRSKKSGSPRRNKKFMTNDLDGIGQSGNSLDQDSDRVRYNRLLEKETAKLSKETKKNNTNGSLEKTSKASLDHGGHTTSEKVMQGMAGAADVKPSINMLLNNDEAKQQNRKQKKKKSKSKKKKMADTADINVGGEVAKQRAPHATSI